MRRLVPPTFVLLSFLIIAVRANPGAFVRLNQRSVEYLSSVAADGLPQLIENVTLPPVSASLATITPKVTEFQRPQVVARFIQNKGVRALVKIPRVVVDAMADVNIFFYTIQENIVLTIEGVSITMELHFDRNDTTDTNLISAPECKVDDPTVTIVFNATNSQLAEYEDMIKKNVLSGLRDAVCTTAVEALIYMDQQSLQKDPLAPLPADDVDEGGLSAGEFASDLCSVEKVAEEPKQGGLSSPIQTGPPWSLDLTLKSPPTFTDDDVTFGVDGGVLLAGLKADGVEAARPLDPTLLGKKMIGVMITDYVPNTFFAHVFDYGIGQVDYRIHTEALPSTFRSLAKLLCSKCYLHVTGHLIKKPRVEIDAISGARVLIGANVSVVFHGRESVYDVINATSNMLMTLKPIVRRSRVYGDVALTSIDFDITKIGVGGALSGPLEKMLSFLVPRTLWPAIKKRIRFALHQRGVQLPVMCGVSLEDLALSYTQRAAVIQSDFTFDLPLFVRKFKAYANRKTLEKRGVVMYD